ncbi:MAG: hypothetical protein EAZ55_02035 [Cytophagales bacterium]|nr:MAG: hypothetical protein EAZ55_02035 [Cytophagales bacterium]
MRIYLFAVLLLIGSGLLSSPTMAQKSESEVAVRWHGDTIIRLYEGIGFMSAEERATVIEQRLYKLINENGSVDTSQIVLKGNEEYVHVWVGSTLLLTLTQRDAQVLKSSLVNTALQYQKELRKKLYNKRGSTVVSALYQFAMFLGRLLMVVFCILALLGALWLLNYSLLYIQNFWNQKQLKGVKTLTIGKIKLLSSEQQIQTINALLYVLKPTSFVLLIYLFIILLFEIFPVTRPVAEWLFSLTYYPLALFFSTLAFAVPKILYLVIVWILLFLFLRVLQTLKKRFTMLVHREAYYLMISTVLYTGLGIFSLYEFCILLGLPIYVFAIMFISIVLILLIMAFFMWQNLVYGFWAIFGNYFEIGQTLKTSEWEGVLVQKGFFYSLVQQTSKDIWVPNRILFNGIIEIKKASPKKTNQNIEKI